MQPKRKPRRAYGEGSLTQRKDGLWVGRVDLEPTTGPDGQPVRRRMEKASKSQRTVLDWMAKTKAELATNGRTADPTTTVEAWAAAWLEQKSHYVRPGTMSTYRAVVGNWVTPTIGRKRLAKVAPADVRAVTDAMRTAGRSATSLHNAHTILGGMLEDAVREGALTTNPQRRVKAPNPGKGTRIAFTADQATAIARTAAAMGLTRPIAALFTGMRQSELLGLTWACVDAAAGQINVEWQLRDITYRHGCGGTCGKRRGMDCPTGKLQLPDGLPARHLVGAWWLIPPKTGTARAVPIEPALAAVLARHRDLTADQPNPHGLVWHRPDGHPVLPRDDGTEWESVVVAAGLPATATTHFARHTVATRLLDAGVDVKVAGEILGHASVGTTRGTYQHVSTDLAKAGMAKLGEMLTLEG